MMCVDGANAIKLNDTVSQRYCPWTNGWKSRNHISYTKYFQLRWNIFRKLHGSKLRWHSETTVSHRDSDVKCDTKRLDEGYAARQPFWKREQETLWAASAAHGEEPGPELDKANFW